MKTATAKQKLPSEASSANISEQSANPAGDGQHQLRGNSNEQATGSEQDPNSGVWPTQAVENANSTPEGSIDDDETLAANAEPVELSFEQTPVSGVCQPDNSEDSSASPTNTAKLPDTIIVPIDSIEYDPNIPVDEELTEHIRTSINSPWGKLVFPILVSKLSNPKDGKEWLLWDGLLRLLAFKTLGLTHIRVVVVDGSDEEIRLLAHEIDLVRRHPNAYQQMRQLTDWYELLQHIYPVYKPGGNKAKNAAETKAKGLPSLNELIEKTTGLKKTAFFGKIQTYSGLEPTAIRPYLEGHPNCGTAKKELWLRDLSKFSQEDQKKLQPLLKKLPNPNDAHGQAVREEAVLKADSLPQDELFPIYWEPFWENAKRIADGSVQLIATDPNWHLADDSEKGEDWTLHGVPVAPQMTKDEWHEFGKLAAQKLSIGGHAAILVGVQNTQEVDTILRQHLRWRWTQCYLLCSGIGTVARKARMNSHYRNVLIYEHKDGPKRTGTYKQFVHDVVPKIPKVTTVDDALIGMLKLERKEIDERIAELEAGGNDPFMNDVITTYLRDTHLLKLWHPWAQHLDAWVKIIQQWSQAGDFLWEPFVGSGTTAIAAVTCTDRVLQDGKWMDVKAPRRGIGCDFMEIWAKVAKFRVWESQHPEGIGSFLKNQEGEAQGTEEKPNHGNKDETDNETGVEDGKEAA